MPHQHTVLKTFEGEKLMFGACLLPKDLGEPRSSSSRAWEVRFCEVWTSEILPKYLSEPGFYYVKRHRDHSNTYNRKHFTGVAYGSVHYRHGRVQADLALEREWRVLHLDLQAVKAIVPPHWA